MLQDSLLLTTSSDNEKNKHMDHFKRDLTTATFDQLTKSQHEVLG